jgi:nitrite reductase/ring-hydroxylating ferredoxin subunit
MGQSFRRARAAVAVASDLPDDSVTMAHVAGVELVVIRHTGTITVFEGRCPHQGTLLSEGSLDNGVPAG